MAGSSWGLSRAVTGGPSGGWSSTHAGSGPAAERSTGRADSHETAGWAGRTARRWAGAASVVLVVGLSGCGTTGDSGASGEPSPAASATTPSSSTTVDVTPSPTSTLTPEEQQAFEDATNTVVAYRQTIVDLYTGARTNLNDLNDVATGALLDQNLKNVQQGLAAGRTANPPGVRVDLVDSRVLRSSMESKPKEMVLLVCIDATAGTTTEPDGTQSPGKREALEYTVVATDYLPSPGWAVSHVAGAASEAARAC